MKRFIITAIQVAGLAAFAAGPPLQDFCTSFNGKDFELIWEAPTNLPASVKIMKVVTTKFSPETISNLLWLAELTPKNKKRSTQPDGVLAGKDVLVYADKDETRHLDIIPSQGAIGLTKAGKVAVIPKETPVGVPDDKEALRLALNILEKIGISRSELATGTNGKPLLTYAEGSVIHKDKPSGQILTNVIDRTISLTRQIAGIPVWGMAGISIKFGNEGKLAYLEATWRAVKPDKDCPVPNASEFVNRIKSGRVLIRSEQENAAFKKITITKASFYYWENSSSEPQSYLYPFAVLAARTDLQGENSEVQLFVPFANE